MPRTSSACDKVSTRGRLFATRNSTASVSGASPCGDSVAGRPLTRSVGASSPARPPKQSMAGNTSSLSFTSVSACSVTVPPRAVAYSVTSTPQFAGRRDTGALPSVNRTSPSLPLNVAKIAHRFQPWSIATVWPARTAARTASPRLARARPATLIETQPEGMPAGCDIVRAQESARSRCRLAR
eukprot:5701298-Pleurochrysis_carterae.AAC.1